MKLSSEREVSISNATDEANKYINSQEIYGYFADYLNAIENRIYNLQVHLLTIKPKHPFINSDNEPAANDEVIWI